MDDSFNATQSPSADHPEMKKTRLWGTQPGQSIHLPEDGVREVQSHALPMNQKAAALLRQCATAPLIRYGDAELSQLAAESGLHSIERPYASWNALASSVLSGLSAALENPLLVRV